MAFGLIPSRLCVPPLDDAPLSSVRSLAGPSSEGSNTRYHQVHGRPVGARVRGQPTVAMNVQRRWRGRTRQHRRSLSWRPTECGQSLAVPLTPPSPLSTAPRVAQLFGTRDFLKLLGVPHSGTGLGQQPLVHGLPQHLRLHCSLSVVRFTQLSEQGFVLIGSFMFGVTAVLPELLNY